MRRNDDPLKSDGNLTYLEFISLVKKMWESVNPEIPIVPTQGKNFAQYPCISYGLEFRKTSANETKARIRNQVLDPQFSNLIVTGQRYDNYITFSVHTENDPILAEHIIEQFEDFMEEYTGTFKQLGLSEMVYGRRLSDKEANRESKDICVRSVAYMVTIEKIRVKEYDRIQKILIDARLFLEHNRSNQTSTFDPSSVEITLPDTYADATPSY